MEAVPGQVVYSKAGRDKGRIFIIYKCRAENDGYVYIADGKLRKTGNAKLKKLKHLMLTGDIIGMIEAKLKNNIGVTDAEIRKALKEYTEAVP